MPLQQGQLSLRGTGQEFAGSFPISAAGAALLPLSIHRLFIHSFILTPGKHVTDARMRVPAASHLLLAAAAPRGVVQLRRRSRRHLEGRVPYVAQDFPMPRLECGGPFRKVAGSILRDVGKASSA